MEKLLAVYKQGEPEIAKAEYNRALPEFQKELESLRSRSDLLVGLSDIRVQV